MCFRMLVSNFLDKIQLKYQFFISIGIYSVDDSQPLEPLIVYLATFQGIPDCKFSWSPKVKDFIVLWIGHIYATLY